MTPAVSASRLAWQQPASGKPGRSRLASWGSPPPPEAAPGPFLPLPGLLPSPRKTTLRDGPGSRAGLPAHGRAAAAGAGEGSPLPTQRLSSRGACGPQARLEQVRLAGPAGGREKRAWGPPFQAVLAAKGLAEPVFFYAQDSSCSP